MNPKRKQRLIIILGIVFGVSVAAALIGVALKENINLYFSPTQMAAGEAPVGKTIRVGGLVVAGSVTRGEGLTVAFDVTDTKAVTTIYFDGILPDLFREGQGIIALGKIDQTGRFVAEEVLAKHDEEYMPPEVQEAIDKAHPGGV
ncbi:MAG: cytochrome c maturation protein CcmE [Gammaproteobacteria bacterium]|nr:MAG: cytochrome c maturation protein CcmE [Gammaproteobacteria bacterium]